MNEVEKTMETPGWAIIEQYFHNEIEKMLEFDVGDKTPSTVATNYIARQEARRIIKKVLKDVHNSKTIKKVKESWR